MPPAPPPPTFTVGGTVSGLTGSVTLANNGGDARIVSANGGFTFATALNSGAAYSVTVTSQPANQTCTVVGGTGSVAANVSNVAVSCATTSFSVGGTITGLSGSVTLTNNGGDSRTVNADGTFAFATTVAAGQGYNVTVATQPANQACAVTGGAGTIGAANITTVSIACETVSASATVGPSGGTVTGPDGVQVIIPPGALNANTVIRIARATSGMPALPEDVVIAGRVYEITPHDIRFNTDVLVRLPIPSPATGDSVLVAEADGSWQHVAAEPSGGSSQVTRVGFSYFAVDGGCGSASPCIRLSSNLEVASTPVGAITRNSSGVGGYLPNAPSMYWTIQQPGRARLWFRYTTSNTCSGHRLRFARVVNPPPPPAPQSRLQVLLERPDSPAPFGNSSLHGDVTFDVTDELTQASTEFHVTVFCSGGGRERATFGQAIVLGGPMAPLPSVTIGGTVSGLVGSGLVLQNNGGDDLSIAANGSFTFNASVLQGSSYSATVRTQPVNENCTVSNASGIATANVTSINVVCVPTLVQAASFSIITTNTHPRVATLFQRGQGNGALTSLGSVSVSSEPNTIAITSDGRFAYVANMLGESVQPFAIQRGPSPALLPLTSRAVLNPSSMVIDPLQERFLWVTNYGFHQVSTYAINGQTGELTPVGSPIGAGGSTPSAIAAHPNGNFVYTINEASSSISTFSVDRATGSLTAVGSPLNQAISSGRTLLVAPGGQFAYAMGAFGTIARLTVNATTGQIGIQGNTFTPSVSSCYRMIQHPNGRSLYLACTNVLGASVTTYSVDPSTGALTWQAAMPLGTNGACSVSIEPNGNFLHAVHTPSSRVYSFSIDANGALSANGSTATAAGPVAIASTN